MMSRIHSFTIAWANLFVERGFLTILRRINMSRPCHRNFTGDIIYSNKDDG